MTEGQPPLLESERRASPLQGLLGYRLVDWGPDRAVLLHPIRPEHLNRTGLLHGGLHATLLDTALGYAGCYTGDPQARRAAVTLSLTVNYLGSVAGGEVRAEGRRTGGGKTIFFADGRLLDAEGRVLATATGTYRYLPPGP